MTATGDTATSKLELIMGRDGLARLADSTVMVLGVGGVGSNCVEALARGGVGKFTVSNTSANRKASGRSLLAAPMLLTRRTPCASAYCATASFAEIVSMASTT